MLFISILISISKNCYIIEYYQIIESSFYQVQAGMTSSGLWEIVILTKVYLPQMTPVCVQETLVPKGGEFGTKGFGMKSHMTPWPSISGNLPPQIYNGPPLFPHGTHGGTNTFFTLVSMSFQPTWGCQISLLLAPVSVRHILVPSVVCILW